MNVLHFVVYLSRSRIMAGRLFVVRLLKRIAKLFDVCVASGVCALLTETGLRSEPDFWLIAGESNVMSRPEKIRSRGQWSHIVS